MRHGDGVVLRFSSESVFVYPITKKTRPYRGEAEIGRGDGRICQRQIARAQKDSVGVRVGRRDADAGTRLCGLRDGGVCIWMVFHGGGGAVTHALGDAVYSALNWPHNSALNWPHPGTDRMSGYERRSDYRRRQHWRG